FRERFPERGQLSLRSNFRSAAGVIAFVNALFQDAFGGEEHALRVGRDVAMEDSQERPCQIEDEAHSGERPRLPAVEFLWASEANGRPGRKPPVEQRRASEARWIAQVVAGRLEAGWL